MNGRIRFFGATALIAGVLAMSIAGAVASGFPDGPRAVHLIVEPDQQMGQTLTASTGDVVYSDSRTAAYRKIVVNNGLLGVCAGGVCHKVPAGEEYVPIPYGMSLYCTKGQFAERASLFSKRMEHSCIKVKTPGDLTNVEAFSIYSFNDQLRITPETVNMGNYLRLDEERLDGLPDGFSDAWRPFFEPVQVVYMGASDGRIRFRIASAAEGGASRTVSYPYQGGAVKLPMPGVNPKAGDTDFEKVSFGGTDEEVTGMTMNVESANETSITYGLQQVTFERQFMGSTINLSQGSTTISLSYGSGN